MEKYGKEGHATDSNIIKRMPLACWITKATNTQPEYVELLAFASQQRLRKSDSMLRFTHITCPVLIYIFGVLCEVRTEICFNTGVTFMQIETHAKTNTN
jgi:hypothetical protein